MTQGPGQPERDPARSGTVSLRLSPVQGMRFHPFRTASSASPPRIRGLLDLAHVFKRSGGWECVQDISNELMIYIVEMGCPSVVHVPMLIFGELAP